MTRHLAALSLALVIGAAPLHARPKPDDHDNNKDKRGPLEVWRDRDRPNRTSGKNSNSERRGPLEVWRDRDRPNRTSGKNFHISPNTSRIHDRDAEERRVRHQRHRRRHEDDDRDDFRADRNTRPPGWSKGRKTGWGNCDVPPGQAKKFGCHPHSDEHHHDKRRG